MLVTPGFLRRTGYHFRVMRELEALSALDLRFHVYLLSGGYRRLNGRRKELAQVGFPHGIDASVVHPAEFRRWGRCDLLHCQNISPGVLASWQTRLGFRRTGQSLLLDYHGSRTELRQKPFGHFRERLAAETESWWARHRYPVICVSEIQKQALMAEVGFPPEGITVLPNYPGEMFYAALEDAGFEMREKLRNALGLPPAATVLLYVGNAQSWQDVDFWIGPVSEALRASDDLFLLVVTGEPVHFRKKLAGMPERRVLIRSAPNEEVPSYLVASDFGLMARRICGVNRVACPTKGMEYLAAGLPMVLTPGIGDMARFAERAGGFVPWTSDSNLLLERMARFKTRRMRNQKIPPDWSPLISVYDSHFKIPG